MKYENLKRVQEIASSIDSLNRLLNYLKNNNITINVIQGNYNFLTISPNEDVIEQQPVKNFITSLCSLYIEEIEKLNRELATL